MTTMSAETPAGGYLGRTKPPLLTLEIGGATDVGRERVVNEDAIYPDAVSGKRFYTPSPDELARKGQLLLVADGIGGEQFGSVASQWAIYLIAERYYTLPGADLILDLREAIEYANAALYRYLQSAGAMQAGSTLAAAVIHGEMLYLANVGDSRVYLLRQGALYQQTRDHTLAQQKADQGVIPQSETAIDPDAGVLTRALGAAPAVTVDIFRPLPLAPGDMVVLCSDGLYELIPEAEIARVALSAAPRRAVERLIEDANERGGYDNISLILVRVSGSAAARADWLAPLKTDLAQLPPSQRRMLWIALAVIALVIFVAALMWGWRLYAPAAPATSGMAVLLALCRVSRRCGWLMKSP